MMNSGMSGLTSYAPMALSILRIASGFTFMLAGTQKIFAFPVSTMPGGGTVEFMSQMWIGGMIETITGILICIGFFTRPAAFLASGTMAVAYWQFHAVASAWPTVNKGALAMMYCFIFLYIFTAGGGAWTADRLLKRK